jgi:hypothetical protein
MLRKFQNGGHQKIFFKKNIPPAAFSKSPSFYERSCCDVQPKEPTDASTAYQSLTKYYFITNQNRSTATMTATISYTLLLAAIYVARKVVTVKGQAA